MASANAEITVYIDSNDPAVVARMQQLIADNERYRRALEWYADEGNYNTPYVYIGDYWEQSAMEIDNGERAQRALDGKNATPAPTTPESEATS